jgi:hypothetical protein
MSSPVSQAKRLASASEKLKDEVAEMQTAIFAAYQALRRGETRRVRAFLEPFAVLENPHDDDLADDDFEEA